MEICSATSDIPPPPDPRPTQMGPGSYVTSPLSEHFQSPWMSMHWTQLLMGFPAHYYWKWCDNFSWKSAPHLTSPLPLTQDRPQWVLVVTSPPPLLKLFNHIEHQCIELSCWWAFQRTITGRDMIIFHGNLYHIWHPPPPDPGPIQMSPDSDITSPLSDHFKTPWTVD